MVRDKGRNRHAHHCVQHIPDYVEAGNLVRHELHREHDAADHQNPGVAERIEPRRQSNPLRARENAQRQHGGIDVQPGREAGCDDKRRDVCRAEVHVAGILRPQKYFATANSAS